MTGNPSGISQGFQKLAGEITSIGLQWHADAIVENSKWNKQFISKSIKDVPRPQGDKAAHDPPALHAGAVLDRHRERGFGAKVIARTAVGQIGRAHV